MPSPIEHTVALFGKATSATTSLFEHTKATVQQHIGAASSSSFTRPIWVTVIAIVIVILVIFMSVRWTRGSGSATGPATIIKGPMDLYSPKSPVILSRDVTSTMRGTYTFSFYLRVDAVPDMREATPLFTWPGVWSLDYSPAQEELVWTFQQTPDAYGDGGSSAAPVVFVLPGIPLQRWSQITMVFEGRSADLFVNGILVKSALLPNVPPSANASLTLVSGVLMGSLAFIQLWPNRTSGAAVAANFSATSDSQGRPLVDSGVLASLKHFQFSNLFCPSGNCERTAVAPPSHKWTFPYA